jgi:hypothetical protein
MEVYMNGLDGLRMLLGIEGPDKDNELALYLEYALEFVLGYTRRKNLPTQLEGAWVRVAAALYNRRGMEGLERVIYGDTQRVADTLPIDILRQLNAFRVARCVDTRRSV